MWDEKIMDNLMFPFGFSNAERLLVILRGNFYTHIQEYWTNVFHLWGYTDWGGGGEGEGSTLCEPRPEYEYSFLDCRQGIEERISLG